MVRHEIPPVYDENSRILILGTMPSPKSREYGFYYMHPQNRFWRALGGAIGEDFSGSIESKKSILLKRNIALWDVLASCEIVGASDSSIKNEIPNYLEKIFSAAKIEKIFTTGKTAEKLFKKHFSADCTVLYSPSAANCAISLEKLIDNYGIIAEALK